MPKQKSASILLCFPTSSSTPSLAGGAGITKAPSRTSMASGSRLGSSLLSGIYFFFLLFANVSLLCVGSFFLTWLEQPAEDDLRLRLAAKRAAFVERYLHNSSSSAFALDQLLGHVQDAAQKGIVTNYPNGDQHHNSVWSFGSAFLFLTTIATTVGYGHAAPQSGMGKAFSMIYGTIAIPLLLAFFGELIRKLVSLLNVIFVLTIGRLCHQNKQSSGEGSSVSSSSTRVKVGFVLFVSLLLIFSTMIVPAFIFTTLEPRWSFLDALYYCFISMTTVGLGDVVPGEGPEWNVDPAAKELYHISVALYLLIALPLFFLAIKLVSSLVSTAEMSFRMPFCCGDDRDARIDGGECGPSRSKPRIKVSRNHDHGEASDSDDDDMYDASSGLIGKIRADSETQISSDGESAADDDVVRRGSVNNVKQSVLPPATLSAAGSFTYLFPQPNESKKTPKQ